MLTGRNDYGHSLVFSPARTGRNLRVPAGQCPNFKREGLKKWKCLGQNDNSPRPGFIWFRFSWPSSVKFGTNEAHLERIFNRRLKRSVRKGEDKLEILWEWELLKTVSLNKVKIQKEASWVYVYKENNPECPQGCKYVREHSKKWEQLHSINTFHESYCFNS